jgi:hypothetical protein
MEEDQASSSDEESSPLSINQDRQVEICPGIYCTLRSVEETEDAWNNGRCAFMDCCICTVKLAFLADSEFVICPDCDSILPVDGRISDGSLPGLTSSISSSFSSMDQRGVSIAISVVSD